MCTDSALTFSEGLHSVYYHPCVLTEEEPFSIVKWARVRSTSLHHILLCQRLPMNHSKSHDISDSSLPNSLKYKSYLKLILFLAMSPTPSLVHFRSLILSHSNDRLLILSELLLLYITTHLTHFILSLLSPRFRLSPPHRQRQLSIIPPIILTKLVSINLIFTTIYFNPSTTFISPFSVFRDVSLVDELFDYWFLITIGYVFELLYRPSPTLLQGHHLILQVFNFYYPLFLRHQPQNGLFSGFLFILVTFGLGIEDTVVDIFVLFYRTLPVEGRAARWLVRGLGVTQELTRALEWAVVGWYLLAQLGEARRLVGTGELIFWGLLLVGWVWTEIDDWVKLRSMWKKFGRKVDEKRE